MKLPIYMDCHATTPLDPRVREEMMPCLTEEYGNASSVHYPLGWRASRMIAQGREQVAHLIGAAPEEIVFTGSATEAVNLAIKGAAENYAQKGNHIITQTTEHDAGLDTCRYLEKHHKQITYLSVDRSGRISLEELKGAITDKTVLVSIMFANNEIGTLQPIAEIAKITKSCGVLLHVDAAQAVGKIPIQVDQLGIDLMSVSAHKVYGPKGVGALYVRHKNPHVRVTPLVHGGGHERGLRSGTLNVPGIVGFGKAYEIAGKEMASESERVKELRDHLEAGFKKELDHVVTNGHPTERLPNNLNMSFAYIEGESLLMGISNEIAVSMGSACASGSHELSHVLKALGLEGYLVHSAIRFGLGRFNTKDEVDYVVCRVTDEVKRLRAMSPLYQEIVKGGTK